MSLQLHLRDNQSQRRSIKDMAGELSNPELLELARETILAGRYSAIASVKEQIARLKEAKMRAKDEESPEEELPTTSVIDLTRFVLDKDCRIIDPGSGKACWNITFEGTDLKANRIKFMATLSKAVYNYLIFTGFMPAKQ